MNFNMLMKGPIHSRASLDQPSQINCFGSNIPKAKLQAPLANKK